jgi:hypothetical protein
MYDEIANESHRPLGMPASKIFRLGLGEFIRRGGRAPKVVADAVLETLRGEGRNLADVAFSLFEALPPGLLENSGIAEYLRGIFEMRGRSDEFGKLARELYLVAVDLDTGEAVPFGERGHREVPISLAVQASTALPGLYRPVRIGDRDFVDGGVKKTAHINLAIRHGAGLVVCINPIVPILNAGQRGPLNGHLANKGVTYVLDQTLRIMLHGRMRYGMERYENEHPEVDILLLQPARDDMRMFRYNIMRYSARSIVALHGYRSCLHAFRANADRYQTMLAGHGITLRDPFSVPDDPGPAPYDSELGRRLAGSLDLLESKLNRL